MQVVLRLNIVCVLSVAMLSGCQSSRFPAWFPPVAAYHAGPAVVPLPTDTAANTVLPPDVPEPPVLTAALPAEKELEAPTGGYVQQLPVAESFVGEPIARQAPPDTISPQRTTRPTIEQMRDGDKLNAIIHTIGGVLLAIGIVLVVVALTITSPGWGALAALVYGT